MFIVTSVGKTGVATKKTFKSVEKAEQMFFSVIKFDHVMYAQIVYGQEIHTWTRQRGKDNSVAIFK